MLKKRTTDLFRFVTLRSPQLINQDNKGLGFVEHPNPALSHFLTQIAGVQDVDIARQNLEAAVDGSNPYETIEAVKSATPQLWPFSAWLAANKNGLTTIAVDANIPSSLPGQDVILRIWETCFHDMLTKGKLPLRQACLQLITAYAFVEKYQANILQSFPRAASDTDEMLLTRLANGKVIVPQAFTQQEQPMNTGLSIAPAPNFIKTKAQYRALLAGVKLKSLKQIKEELLALSKVYKADYESQYNTALTAYGTQVEQDVASYIATNPIPHEPLVNNEDLYLESHFPRGFVDEFSFNFTDPLEPSYTVGKISVTTAEFISAHDLTASSIDEAILVIENQEKTRKQQLSQRSRKSPRRILINGATIDAQQVGKFDYALGFESGDHIFGGSNNKKLVYFMLNVGQEGTFLLNGTFTLTIDRTPHISTLEKIVSNDAGSLFLELFSGATLNVEENIPFTLNANLELNDGRSLNIFQEGFTQTDITIGRAIVVKEPTQESTPIYGVNKIGYADYRRVEQELCCYIAGEVSHIENILAKEYKEKASRNLLSSEVTINQTTEHEMEEMTDTVSTSRHELSTEIAAVINKDRSQHMGFNASVSGDFLKQSYNAGIAGDFAFAQSTSDSNITARNYAEDVTKRALERIVQKTTVQRTSRILKEYEENVKHGFDNREGNNHVTGVYRWIDKVYKNKLVNYGKRMVYEFMVPEPARFYKEAIIIEAEETQTNNDSGGADNDKGLIIEPKHPSAYEIKNAGDISRSNFKELGSHYGIKIDPPLDGIVTVSGTYSEAIGGKNQPQAFTYNDLYVPQDYECRRITGTGSFHYYRLYGPKADFYLGAVGQKVEKLNLATRGGVTVPVTINSKNFSPVEQVIPVSIRSRQVTSFTVSLNAVCYLKTSIFEQWQQDAYDAIMRAYNQQLQVFRDAQAQNKADQEIFDAQQAQEPNEISRNARFNVGVVETELKRLCIEMMLRPFRLQQGKDFYEEGQDCKIPQIRLGSELDRYASLVKFMEQAFDWRLMSYIFYPYYWAKKCDWKALFQSQDSIDYIFQTFLQSGMGRVLVPVREGFEAAVVYFMKTGEVWQGTGIVFDTDDELYLSIVDELNTADTEVTVEEEWDTVVPSSLKIVQARSVLLDEEGLPCCETDAEVLAELNLRADTNVLQLLNSAP